MESQVFKATDPMDEKASDNLLTMRTVSDRKVAMHATNHYKQPIPSKTRTSALL